MNVGNEMNDIPTVPSDDCGCGTTERMIYLGKLPNMDLDKTTQGPDGAYATTAGMTFGSATDPLYRQMTQVTLNDTNGDGIIPIDGATPSSETITHSLGGSEADYTVNTAFNVHVSTIRVQLPDGSVQEYTSTLRVMQDSDGNTFLMPPPNNAPDYELAEMLTHPILSVTFSSDPAHYGRNEPGVTPHEHCFPCFVRGTLIETEFGAIQVEELTEGMRVWTRDNGLQPIRWIGSRVLGPEILGQNNKLKPIRIRAGALGVNMPSEDLLVSPQHRILVRSNIAQKMFGTDEVLVAAKQLLQIQGIDTVEGDVAVEYFHFLFDQHEIGLSNGAETESLYTGPEALRALGPEASEEIFTLFPELRNGTTTELPVAARHLATGRMGRKLAVRHVQNGRALVQ